MFNCTNRIAHRLLTIQVDMFWLRNVRCQSRWSLLLPTLSPNLIVLLTSLWPPMMMLLMKTCWLIHLFMHFLIFTLYLTLTKTHTQKVLLTILLLSTWSVRWPKKTIITQPCWIATVYVQRAIQSRRRFLGGPVLVVIHHQNCVRLIAIRR